eukprot:sb/3476401/
MESDESLTSIPEMEDESVGSSVSERLQEEYESLLKYALVTPAGVFSNGESLLPNQTEEQLRLLRTTNPSPVAFLPPLPPQQSEVCSVDDLPVKLIPSDVTQTGATAIEPPSISSKST